MRACPRWYVRHLCGVRKSTQLLLPSLSGRVADWWRQRNPGTRMGLEDLITTNPQRRTMMSDKTVYGAAVEVAEAPKKRIKVRAHRLQQWKNQGHKWSMPT